MKFGTKVLYLGDLLPIHHASHKFVRRVQISSGRGGACGREAGAELVVHRSCRRPGHRESHCRRSRLGSHGHLLCRGHCQYRGCCLGERGTPGAVEMRTRNMTRRAASVFRARHTRTAGSIVLMDCLMGEKQVSCTRAYRCSSDADCQFHG